MPAELKFYDFFTNDPIGCEFIEKPFKIELVPKPVVFMESSGMEIDLFEFIDSNSFLPDKTIKTIFNQIVKALVYLHENNIVHRDIKVCKSVSEIESVYFIIYI